jgi:membrane protein YdbS with pleckstrin-like domain
MQPDEKKCPLCGEIIKTSAVKCRFCGEFLDKARQGAADPMPASPLNGSGPAQTADGKVYFKGTVSKIELLGPALYGLAVLVLAIAVAALAKKHLSAPHSSGLKMAYYFSGGIVLCWLVYFMAKYTAWKSRLYLVTTERVECETGLLNKTIESFDLLRVRDIRFDQTITQKMLGVGSVSFFTADRGKPPLVLGPITNARKLYDTMKEVQINTDRKRGVVRIES